ncbi:MAG: phage major capsid protein [Clostridia bacterium]|nr:phage major capsid protein [Clostridia bacterium]
MANFDNIRLEKGLYCGGSFTAALESIDPSDNYKGSSLEGLDAYQRQLKRFDIKVSGAGSDTVEKFFKTSDSATLFPEYVARAVRQGIEEANVLPKLIASVTNIDSLDYRSITSVPSDEDKALLEVEEGTEIPQTEIKTNENLVKLRKRGRMLVASYEAIRFQRLDLFTVTLRQIGAHIAKAQLADAIDTIINGDGNDNAAASTAALTSGTLSYADIINLWKDLDPYEMNILIANTADAVNMLNLSEFKDSAAGLNFHATGKMITPIGAELIRSSAVPAGTVIGLDRNCALEMVKAGEVMTEYDKLIDRQLERAAITSIAGFAKIFTDASRTLAV